jgi:hypothetical protein
MMRRGRAITAGLWVLFLARANFAIAGTWTTLDYPGAIWTQIHGIDGSNVVGYDAYGSHGFLYDGSNWTDIPGKPHDIDGSKVVGEYNGQGYIYDLTSSTLTTFDAPGAYETTAYGIDGSNIVGRYRESGGGNYHGFLYDGANWTIIDAPGASQTHVFGIDGSNIVGRYNDDSGWGYHGFLYNYEESTWTTFDTPWPYTYIFAATGISGGNIVGYYTKPTMEEYGFLYDGVTWTTLDSPASYESFTEAWGIDGSNIVGTYYDAGYHGFIYTIPEPATLLLLGMGALILRKRS